MDLLNEAPPAELTRELIDEVQRVQEELRAVCEVIDDLRNSIDKITRGYRQDDWQPVQRRPIVSFPVDLSDPEFARKINAVDPDTLPAELPEVVRSAVAARLRESQRPGGMDSRAEPHRHDDNRYGQPSLDLHREQRALWEEPGDREDNGAVNSAAGAAKAAPEPTPQKEAEPTDVEADTPTDRDDSPPAMDADAADAPGVEPQGDLDQRPVAPLAGHELVALMNRHKVTIGELARRTGITQKRIRQAREHGLGDPHAVRDWVQAIQGRDPGPAGEIAAGSAYTLDDWTKFRQRCLHGDTNAAVLQGEFARIKAGKSYFIETLINTKSADQLRMMAVQRGILDARRHTKQKNAAAIYRVCLSSFTLGDSVSYQPLKETYEEAVERLVLAITDEQIAAEHERVNRRQEEQAKALNNPETLLEFATFSRERGLDELTDEQFARWDTLHADRIREDRKSRKQRETVEQFQSGEIAGIEFRIVEGYHDREQVPLWIVQLSTRVERDSFQELKIKATQLGGWWSSFKKDASGFQFRSRESAEKFAGLTEGDVDRSEELLARKLRKMENACERLLAVAENLEAKATEVLETDDAKLKNTARRADMAASMRAAAYSDQANAKTLRSIAAALDRGEAKYLDGLWNAAQVRSLETILKQGRRERIKERLREEGKEQRSHGWSQRYDELEAEPLSAADARFAAYPKPYLYRGHLVQAFAQLENKPGVKQITAKMRKLADSRPKDQDCVEFVNEYQIQLLEDFLGRAKAAGMKTWHFDHCLDLYKRLQSANIDDAHELRSALRELAPHLATAAGDDPVKRAEDELRGKDLPGFFPTPRPVIEQMLELAAVEPAQRVLEPSCGKGDILDAIRRQCPDVTLTAIERNLTLQGVLAAKGYDEVVSYEDFLGHEGQYDRIIMNPPFEQGQDMTHVRHAYDLLAAGGRIVAVMCEGAFFREDANSRAFRSWLDEVEHDVEKLPEDVFKGVEAFRQTSVRTAIVTIDKPQ